MKKYIAALNLFLFLLQADAQNLEWAKAIGGTMSDWGSAIVVDTSGNIYSTGSFIGTADFDPGPGIFNLSSAGDEDIFISKLDSSGIFIWARKIGGIGSDEAYSIAVDKLENIYITGRFEATVDFDPSSAIFNLTSAGQGDIFIIKINSSGNFVWAKRIGGIDNEWGHSVTVDISCNVYITGNFQETVDFNPGVGIFNLTSYGWVDIFVSKLDSSGNFIWAKQMGGPDFEWGKSIAVDPSGYVYITGDFEGTVDFDPGTGTFNLTSAGEQDVYIIKLDSLGNFVWTKQMGGADQDWGISITVDPSGNIYTTGFFKGISDYDPGSGIYNLISAGDYEIFISKLNTSGNFIWAKAMGGTSWDQGYSIAVDNLGNVYTCGLFSGTADFDPGAGIFNLTSSGSFDIFLSKLDGSGNFVWASQFGETGIDAASSIAFVTNCIYVTGFFSGSVDFDPGGGTFNLTSAGAEDIFILKLSQLNTGVEELQKAEISVYPNPANDKIMITSANKEIGEMKIYDVVGKLIKYELISERNAEIEVPELKSGLYFLELRNQRFKLIKQ